LTFAMRVQEALCIKTSTGSNSEIPPWSMMLPLQVHPTVGCRDYQAHRKAIREVDTVESCPLLG